MAPLDRREFLRRSAAAGLGLGCLPAWASAAAEAPRVRRRVVLGRTGLSVPDVGFGASRLRADADLVRYALDRGVTYFDTAESYTGGHSEEVLGRALQGVRERVVLASKVQAEAADDAASLMRRLEASLVRLRTDYVDVYFNHAVNDVARIANPAWAEFSERAREQGKLRWRGMSGHGGRLVECLEYALERDLVDVVLVAFHFGQDPRFHEHLTRDMDFVARQPELPRVLALAKQKNVGVLAMKTLRGGRLNDMRPYETGGATFAQAALRWTLSHPHVDAAVISMQRRELVDEYLGASGWTAPRHADLPLLAAYEGMHGRSQCRYGCSACEEACPAAVAIPEVLRARMYARDYAEPELARAEYAALGAAAEACLSCSARPCASACPFGLPVAELTAETHRLLG